MEVTGSQRDVCRPVEWRISGEHLAEQAAERVDVGRGRHDLPEALLRRHVRRGADGPVDLRQAWRGQLRAPIGRGLLAGVVDGRGAGVLQLGGGADLAQEPLAVALQCVEDLDGLWAVRAGGTDADGGRSSLIATRRSRRSS